MSAVAMPVRWRALALLDDFAIGVDDEVQGLTLSEFDRAWVARHGPGAARVRKALAHLASVREIVRLPHGRYCAVTGMWRHPWVPLAYVPGEWRAACS